MGQSSRRGLRGVGDFVGGEFVDGSASASRDLVAGYAVHDDAGYVLLPPTR